MSILFSRIVELAWDAGKLSPQLDRLERGGEVGQLAEKGYDDAEGATFPPITLLVVTTKPHVVCKWWSVKQSLQWASHVASTSHVDETHTQTTCDPVSQMHFLPPVTMTMTVGGSRDTSKEARLGNSGEGLSAFNDKKVTFTIKKRHLPPRLIPSERTRIDKWSSRPTQALSFFRTLSEILALASKDVTASSIQFSFISYRMHDNAVSTWSLKLSYSDSFSRPSPQWSILSLRFLEALELLVSCGSAADIARQTLMLPSRAFHLEWIFLNVYFVCIRGPSRQIFGQISAQNLSKILNVCVKVWTKQTQKNAC